jgi:hypothetical protein
LHLLVYLLECMKMHEPGNIKLITISLSLSNKIMQNNTGLNNDDCKSGLTLSGRWEGLHLLLKIPKAHSTHPLALNRAIIELRSIADHCACTTAWSQRSVLVRPAG